MCATSRSRDAQATRAAMVQAAQRLFSERGYAQTGVREIAAEVGVDAALVNRYFGSKRQLFEACLIPRVDLPALFAKGAQGFGERMLGALLDKPSDDPNLMMMLLLAGRDAEVGSVAAELYERHFLQPLTQSLQGKHRRQRATLIALLITGFWMHRSVLVLPELRGSPDLTVRRWLGESLDALYQGGIVQPRVCSFL